MSYLLKVIQVLLTDVSKYCNDWKQTINTNSTKIMGFGDRAISV